MKTISVAANALKQGLWGAGVPFSSVILSEPRQIEGLSNFGIKAALTRSRRMSEIVLGVTEADQAGTGYHLRNTNQHTNVPPNAPQNVWLKSTGIAGQLNFPAKLR